MSKIDEKSLDAVQPHTVSVEALHWERYVFHCPDTADGACPEVIDITGRPRHLFKGPNVELAPGRWRATVGLELCADAARRAFALDFGTFTHWASADLPAGVKGAVEVVLEHDVNPGDLVEIRLWLHKAAFHGEIRLKGVLLERLGNPSQGEKA
ncbi:MAG TPA: hypothetical protein VGH03_21330 [Caulobacteraceae bacterium]|jgi:hypothetical protein